jgi:Mycothiol maleylpyruvate isomerase N-terminal domain
MRLLPSIEPVLRSRDRTAITADPAQGRHGAGAPRKRAQINADNPAVGDSLRRDREASGVNDLAEQFDATWLRFRAAVDDLGEAQMESPTRVGWTAKEMLGHLGFWLEATEGVIVGIFRGEPLRDDFAFESGYVPDPDAPWPTADVHNAREASWARSRSAAEVVARLDAGHTVFTSLLESLRADELTDDRYSNYVDHMCTEFDAHLEELQDLLLTA